MRRIGTWVSYAMLRGICFLDSGMDGLREGRGRYRRGTYSIEERRGFGGGGFVYK